MLLNTFQLKACTEKELTHLHRWPFTQIYYTVCSRVSAKKSLPLEHTVWDPPLVEEGPSQSEPVLPTLDPMAIQPSLTLPACLKDLKVKVTHVTSPGNICVQLLQFDTQLKRYQPHLIIVANLFDYFI